MRTTTIAKATRYRMKISEVVDSARRVVSRPKEMLKMRSEMAFLLRLYLEPILIGRGPGRDHSIELLNLIKVLNLPPAGWHRFKSRRKAIFAKAIQELESKQTTDGLNIRTQIQQGLNQQDFMLVAGLLHDGSREARSKTLRTRIQVSQRNANQREQATFRSQPHEPVAPRPVSSSNLTFHNGTVSQNWLPRAQRAQ